MSELRKAAEQALAALENLDGIDTETECVTICVGDEIDALRTALAGSEQSEPFGYVSEHNCTGPYEYQFHKDQRTIYPDNCRAIHKVYTAPPAQTPPPGEDFCYCGEEISLQSVSGGAAPEGLYGAVTLRVKGEYVRYVKAQTPPPRLTDADFERITGEDIALTYSGDVDAWRAIEAAVRKQFGVTD